MEVRCDAEFRPTPEAFNLAGEVFGELGRVDHQQGFVVCVCRRGRPVEAPSDHGFVVDYSELVIDILGISVAMGGFRAAEEQ